MTFPWTGVSGNIPASNTFTIPVQTGQPKAYHSIDSVKGSMVIKCGNSVTFYRKTFNINDNSQPFYFEMTGDDDMEVYINGSLVAREGSHQNTSAKLPPHTFFTHQGLFASQLSTSPEYFDFTIQNTTTLLHTGQNEIIVAIRNKTGNDNGGFSFRMCIGNPLASGHKVTLTATDNITLQTDTQSTNVHIVDVLPPRFTFNANSSAYLSSNGKAAVNLSNLNTTIEDNCSLKSITYSPDSIHFSNILSQPRVEIVSDNTWKKSLYVNTDNPYIMPWPGPSSFADSFSYTAPVIIGQPYSYGGLYQIPGTEVISTDAYTTFFRKSFDLNIGSIDECLIQLTVDDDIEVYLNGKLIAREGDFSASNSNAPAHSLRFTSNTVQNGYQGGDSFDTLTGNNPLDLLNFSGSNEIIVVIRNGRGNNVGGFSFKLSLPIKQKFHYPATIVATDIYDNISTAYTLITIEDTIAPTVVTTSPILTPDFSGMLSLVPTMFDNGSYDNTSIKSMSIFPSLVACSNAQSAYLTVTDYFDNTSTSSIPLSLVSSLCPTGSGGKKSSSAGSTYSDSDDEDAVGQWNVTAYPMPARNHVTLDMDYVVAKQDVTVEVWDLSGRKVMARSFKSDFPGYYSHQLDISSLAAGEYILKLWHNDQRKTMPLMIN